MMEQASQGGCGCPIPRSIQGPFGWDFEQPCVTKDVPAKGRRFGIR